MTFLQIIGIFFSIGIGIYLINIVRTEENKSLENGSILENTKKIDYYGTLFIVCFAVSAIYSCFVIPKLGLILIGLFALLITVSTLCADQWKIYRKCQIALKSNEINKLESLQTETGYVRDLIRSPKWEAPAGIERKLTAFFGKDGISSVVVENKDGAILLDTQSFKGKKNGTR